MFEDVLPIETHIQATSVRNHLHHVAKRAEAGLGAEQCFFIDLFGDRTLVAPFCGPLFHYMPVVGLESYDLKSYQIGYRLATYKTAE
jgi:hypothetical protein